MSIYTQIAVLSTKEVLNIARTELVVPFYIANSHKRGIIDFVEQHAGTELQSRLLHAAHEKEAAQNGHSRKRKSSTVPLSVHHGQTHSMDGTFTGAIGRDLYESGHFLDVPTNDEIKQCYRLFYEATSNSAVHMAVYAVCGRECRSSLARAQPDAPPAFSLANGLWVGAVPDILSLLTFPEQLLIAQLYPRVYVFKLYLKNGFSGDPTKLQRGMGGTVSTFDLDLPGVVSMVKGNLMPRPPELLVSLISITFIGLGRVAQYCATVHRRRGDHQGKREMVIQVYFCPFPGTKVVMGNPHPEVLQRYKLSNQTLGCKLPPMAAEKISSPTKTTTTQETQAQPLVINIVCCKLPANCIPSNASKKGHTDDEEEDEGPQMPGLEAVASPALLRSIITGLVTVASPSPLLDP
ncbi:hypothetical protein BDZ97DRAFT_1762018 [Flammula alnicola]|nr:hypothetical protein BDZ97DRAFT_1762018 [Flammula alnicola]